jgi:hypothetical protein
MHVEITDFPSDVNGVYGSLRRELIKALRKADTYPTHAPLLADILKYTNKRLAESRRENKGDK